MNTIPQNICGLCYHDKETASFCRRTDCDNKATVYDTQPMIESLTDMSGNIWSQSMIDTYNNLTRDINKSAGIEVKNDSLTQKERDFFMDQRHKHYVMCNSILNKD